jgi:hypothetical protein
MNAFFLYQNDSNSLELWNNTDIAHFKSELYLYYSQRAVQ